MLDLGCTHEERTAAQPAELQATVDALFASLHSESASESETPPSHNAPDCVSTSGTEIRAGRIASTEGYVKLEFNRCFLAPATLQARTPFSRLAERAS